MVKTLARLHGLGRRHGEPRKYRCTSRAPHPHIAKPLESQFTEIPRSIQSTHRAGLVRQRRRHVCEPKRVSSSLAHLAPAGGHDIARIAALSATPARRVSKLVLHHTTRTLTGGSQRLHFL